MRSFSQVRRLISLFVLPKPLERRHIGLETPFFECLQRGSGICSANLAAPSAPSARASRHSSLLQPGSPRLANKTVVFFHRNPYFACFLSPHSPTERYYFLFKRLPVTLACMAFECLLLLVTSPDCCHAYLFVIFFLPGLYAVTASWRDGSFFTTLTMSIFSVLTYTEGSFYLCRIVRFLCVPSLAT